MVRIREAASEMIEGMRMAALKRVLLGESMGVAGVDMDRMPRE